MDWPVAFLGAIYAGIVPVAVNTLLTTADYAYMLSHSRARAAIVSAALSPVLEEALQHGAHDVETTWVIDAHGPLAAGQRDFAADVAAAKPAAAPAATHADDAAFWLYSSGSTGAPKGTVHTHANAYWTDALYGRNVLRLAEDDVVFSAAKLFFAYGLGNALTFPLFAGATTILMPERPDTAGRLPPLRRAASVSVLRCADALRRNARRARPAGARRRCAAAVRVGGRGAAARDR